MEYGEVYMGINTHVPVALDFFTAFLDVPKAPTGIALLLVGMVTVARHVASLATVVAALLAFLLGLLAISGDVTAPATVVACWPTGKAPLVTF